MGALIWQSSSTASPGTSSEARPRAPSSSTGGGGPTARDSSSSRPSSRTDNDITIAQDEIFGPVALVFPFDDPADAIAMANDTRYGLAAYLWTNDLEPRTGPPGVAGRRRLDQRRGAAGRARSWGGLKSSGVGRELGYAGIEANTEEKTVTITL